MKRSLIVAALLAVGLTATAYTPNRENLEEATGLVRLFREQPTPELARSAAVGLTSTLSPNARLQRFWHPWTSYVIVPLFGLANAGIVITGGFLKHAYTQRITLGVMAAYVIGKPLAVFGTTWLVAKMSRRRILPTVGWGAVFGMAVSAAAVIGDLGESMVKRDLGVKDMSSLLPGHGGLMDRLDSIVLAAPTAYLLLLVLAPVA